jgi:HD superfamily phosphohydrolase YqeK
MGNKERQVEQTIQYIGKASVYERQKRGLEVSEAHSASHLRNVADLAVFVADIFDFSPQEKQLSYAAGWLHDAVRSPSEDPSVRDEEASAIQAKRLLFEANMKGDFITTEAERDAVSYAIRHHGTAPQWLSAADTQSVMRLGDKVWLALFVADKMEANGVRVIARRCSFVAGDRLQDPRGDWRAFGFVPDRDEGNVVAIESMLRLAFINPESLYPPKLGPLVKPLYREQRKFVNGLLRGLNLSVEDIATMLLTTKNGEGKSIIEVRNIHAPTDVKELTRVLAMQSGITNETINKVTPEKAASAMETVQYFSHRYRLDLDALVREWKPEGKSARLWAKAIYSYNEGVWLARQKERYHITKPFRALFHL